MKQAASHAAAGPASNGRRVTLLIPERRHPAGPVTRARLRRTFAPIAGAWALGLALLMIDAAPGWKAFALGLLLPGGGFVYTSDPVFAALSFLAFPLALVAWWGLGPVLLAPGVWVGTAALASLRTGTGLWEWAEVAVPVALVALLTAGLTAQQIAFRRGRERARELNEQLRRVEFPISSEPEAPQVTESTPEDLAALRYALDLGLQPLDRFDGFHIMDQFRESALRYQLQFLQYALATSQYTRTPAFTGYLAEAQRNAIEKMLDPRVWRYWRWENLWGNLRWDPDPVARDNVMLSGYWAVMVGLYASLTGDRRYDEPGSLTFRGGEKEVYPYDFPELARVMHRNMSGSHFCMFPCEPNWIYPFCNSYALNTLLLYDRLHRAKLSSVILAEFRERFEQDFLRPDGRVIGIRSKFGMNIPSTVTVSDAVLAYWLNAPYPDIAQRTWWLMRQRSVTPERDELFPTMRGWDLIDPGSYALGTDTFSRGAVFLAAREMGDDEAADAAQRSIDEKEPVEEQNGARRYPGLSVYGNLQHTLARFTRHNSMREMIRFDLPEAWRTGPILTHVAYPDVLVAHAVTDGRALDLVLRAGNGGRRTSLALERLVPEARYRLEGALGNEITTGRDGTGLIAIDLEERTEVRVVPIV